MGLSKNQWFAEYEQIGQDISSGNCDKKEAITRMSYLGFNWVEIEEHLSEMIFDEEDIL